MVERVDAGDLGDRVREAERQLELRPRARHRLVDDLRAPVRVRDDLVVADRVAVHEHAVVGHDDVVEDDHPVLLVEARRERVVERGPRLGERVAQHDLEARRVHRDREAERVGRVLLAAAGCPGRSRSRPRRGRASRACARRARRCPRTSRRPCAARSRRPRPAASGARAVDLRVHDRVRRREVVLAHQLVVADEILGALLVAAAGPHVGARREQRERHVEVVGRAAHHAAVVLRHLAHADAAAHEVVARARLQERDVDGLARRRRGVEARLGVLVAPVEPAGEAACRAAEQRVADDVVDLLAVHPDLAAIVAQPVEELRSGARARRRRGYVDGHLTSPLGSLSRVCAGARRAARAPRRRGRRRPATPRR